MDRTLNMGSGKSEMVPVAMIDALTSANPKYRYKVGPDSKYILSWLEKCHESVQDNVLCGFLTGENVRAAGAPKNAIAMARGRYHKAWGRFIFFCIVALLIVRKLRQ